MRIAYEGKRAGSPPPRSFRASGGGLSRAYVFEPMTDQEVSDADGAILLALRPVHGAFRRLDAAKQAPPPLGAADGATPEAGAKPATGEGGADGADGGKAADAQPPAPLPLAGGLAPARHDGERRDRGDGRPRDQRPDRPAFGGGQGERGGRDR